MTPVSINLATSHRQKNGCRKWARFLQTTCSLDVLLQAHPSSELPSRCSHSFERTLPPFLKRVQKKNTPQTEPTKDSTPGRILNTTQDVSLNLHELYSRLTHAVDHSTLAIELLLFQGSIPAMLRWFHLLKNATLDFLEVTKSRDFHLKCHIILLMVLTTHPSILQVSNP